jgi:hypothetical protein
MSPAPTVCSGLGTPSDSTTLVRLTALKGTTCWGCELDEGVIDSARSSRDGWPSFERDTSSVLADRSPARLPERRWSDPGACLACLLCFFSLAHEAWEAWARIADRASRRPSFVAGRAETNLSFWGEVLRSDCVGSPVEGSDMIRGHDASAAGRRN